MLDFKTIVNSLGLVLTVVGVYLVYANSPINYTVIDGGEVGAGGPSWDAVERKAKLRNILLRVGVYLVMAGSLLQLASNFMAGGNAAT